MQRAPSAPRAGRVRTRTGLVSVVARRCEIVLAEAIGRRNRAGDPMELDTVCHITSASKPLTAAVVMSLVEEGRIGLMQRVVDYLPELPEGSSTLLRGRRRTISFR